MHVKNPLQVATPWQDSVLQVAVPGHVATPGQVGFGSHVWPPPQVASHVIEPGQDCEPWQVI